MPTATADCTTTEPLHSFLTFNGKHFIARPKDGGDPKVPGTVGMFERGPSDNTVHIYKFDGCVEAAIVDNAREGTFLVPATTEEFLAQYPTVDGLTTKQFLGVEDFSKEALTAAIKGAAFARAEDVSQLERVNHAVAWMRKSTHWETTAAGIVEPLWHDIGRNADLARAIRESGCAVIEVQNLVGGPISFRARHPHAVAVVEEADADQGGPQRERLTG